MLLQMVEEQRHALAQAQKEVKSCPMETIKSLRKEIKFLQAQLQKLQRAKQEDISAENPVKQEDKQLVNNPEN